MRFGWMAAVAAMGLAAPAHAAFIEINEVEPNNTRATAQALPSGFGDLIRVYATTEGDSLDYVDFFRFSVDTSRCEPGRNDCYSILATSDFDESSPYLTLFDPDGNDVSPGQNTSLAFVTSSRSGAWTIGIRRASVSAPDNYTLNLIVSAAVPEPTTWAMMIAGIGLVGGVMRRRPTRIVYG